MTILKGALPIAGFISPTDILDTYPTHRDDYGYGGHRTVNDTAARDAISPLRRVPGMLCYVSDISTFYTLYGGTDNTDWRPLFNFTPTGDFQIDLNLPENYVLVGDSMGKAVPSPVLLDTRADLMLLRQGDFVLGHAIAGVPNAQVLSTMPDGLLYSTGGVVTTTPTGGGGGGGLSVVLINDVIGTGVIGTPIPTTLTLTLDKIPLAVDSVNLNEHKIVNLNSVATQVEDAINYEFIQGLIANTLPSGAVARVGYIIADMDIDSQLQRFIFGTQALPETLGGLRLDNARVPTSAFPTETILAFGNTELSGYRFNQVTDNSGGIGTLKLQSFVNNTVSDIFAVSNNNINLYQHRVTNAADPVDAQDYITKSWGIANLSGGGGGPLTIQGFVQGTGTGTITVNLNPVASFDTADQYFTFSNLHNQIILNNPINTTPGQEITTALRFQALGGHPFKFIYTAPDMGFSHFALTVFDGISDPVFTIQEWLYKNTTYVSQFNSSVHIDASSKNDIAGLYVSGGKIDVVSEAISIRATSTANSTKIVLDNDEIGGQGRPYSIGSDANSNFIVKDEIVGNRLLVDSVGNFLVNDGTAFLKQPSFLGYNIVVGASPVITFPSLGVDVKFPSLTTLYSNYVTSNSTSHFVYNGPYSIIGLVIISWFIGRTTGDTNSYIWRTSLYKNGVFFKMLNTNTVNTSQSMSALHNWIPLDPGDTLDIYTAIIGSQNPVTFPVNAFIGAASGATTNPNAYNIYTGNIFAIKLEIA